MPEYTITLSGPSAAENQARNALAAARFDVQAEGHDHGLDAEDGHSWVTCHGEDVNKAWDAVRSLGWRLRIHYHRPPDAPPSFEQQIAAKFAEYESRIKRLEAGGLPPIMGGAVESPAFASQNSTFGAEISRRAIYFQLQRGASIGSIAGGIVSPTDCQVTASAGMNVSVAPGEALVPGSSSATQSGYYGRVSSATVLAIAASDPTNPRIDRISAIEVDKAYAGANDGYSVAVTTGTPTSGANLTNLSGEAAAPTSSLTFANLLVPAGSTSTTNGNIANVAQVVVSGLPDLAYVNGTGSATATPGTWIVAAGGTTQTLPAASKNAVVAITGASGVTPTNTVTVSAGSVNIYGWNSAAVTSFTLVAPGQTVLLESDGTSWYVQSGAPMISRGATNIATSQSTSSTTYTTLATPDQVTGIVLPANGLIRVWYQATWQYSSVPGRAAIFIGSNQLQIAASTGPAVQEAVNGSGAANSNTPLASGPAGLASADYHPYSGDVTTGQIVYGGNDASKGMGGGPCDLFAAAGQYTISVQFKVSSGSVTVSNRKLWVQAIPFN